MVVIRKVPTGNHGGYVMTRQVDWIDVGSDADWATHGGKWARRDPSHTLRFFFLEFTDMAEACGSDHNPDERFVCEVSLVDLSIIPPDKIADAIRSCGPDADWLDSLEPGRRLLALAAAICDYGIKAPLHTAVGRSHPERVRAAARRAADLLMRNASALGNALDSVVNGIGSTARDFMVGDIDAGLRRAAEEVVSGERQLTAQERILMGIWSTCGGLTLGGKTVETVALSSLCSEAIGRRGGGDSGS
jgi:hypothetical protein